MIVVCSNCNASDTIADEKIPKRRAVAVCKNCGQQIIINPDAPGQDSSQPITETGEPSELAIESFNSLLAADYPGLRSLSPDQYAFWKIFLPNVEGGYKNPSNTLKYKLLTATAPVLERVLADSEKVHSVFGAAARSPVDWVPVNRFLTRRYSRYAVVGTHRRLLLIQVDHRLSKPLHYIFQYPYESIRKLGRGLRKGLLVFRTTGGRRWALQAMKHASSEAVDDQVRQGLDHKAKMEEPAAVAENICPACFKPFKFATEACPHCRSVFKSPFGAAIRSMLLPGLGNFYLGRPMPGVFQLLVALILWLVVADAFTAGQTHTLTMALYLILVYNGIVGILTFLAARKGYGLAKKQPRVGKTDAGDETV